MCPDNINDSSVNEKIKSKNTIRNWKLFSKLSTDFILLLSIVISGSIVLIIYFGNLIRDYNLEISILLILVLVIRYIFKNEDINNPFLIFIVDKSIFIITPLLILFLYKLF